jgi:hypothetical protein
MRGALVALVAGCGRLSFEPCGDVARPCLGNELGASGGPVDTGQVAPLVLFQPDFTTFGANAGGAVQRGGVSGPYSLGIYLDPADGRTKLFVNDRLNNRVLVFNAVPTASGALPDLVLGQSDFTLGAINAGQPAVNAVGFSDSTDVSVCGTGELLVADSTNHRVLVWRRVPAVSGAPADFALGQPDLVTSVGGTSATVFERPYKAQCIDRRLFVTEHNNSRILIYDRVPADGSAQPAFVIGQPDFTTAGFGCSATELFDPYEVLHHGDRYYVPDGGNHRVLVFDDSFADGNGAPIAVLGQADFTSCALNRGLAAPDATTLAYPNAVAAHDDVLAVSDHENRRVVFYRLPVTTGAAAFAELGQPTFADSALRQPPDATSMGFTKGLVIDGDFVWLVDEDNNRVITMRLPSGG